MSFLVDLLPPQPTELQDIAELIFGIIGVRSVEQRYSDNYPGGTYLLSSAPGWEATISKYDRGDWHAGEDWPPMGAFELSIFEDSDSISPVDVDKMAKAVATRLLEAGWKIEQL